MEDKTGLTIVVGLFGRYEIMTEMFHEKIMELEQLDDNNEIIIIADGIWWKNVPLFNMLNIKLPKAKIIVNNEESNLPAVVYNIGLKNATKKYITFSNIISEKFLEKQQIFYEYLNSPKKSEDDLVYFIARNGTEYPPLTNIYGYVQAKMYYSLDELCVPLKMLNDIGGFDESELLQCEIERWILLKLSMLTNFCVVGIIQSEFRTLYNVPFRKLLYHNYDLGKRYAIYCNSPLKPFMPAEVSQKYFMLDLPDNDVIRIRGAIQTKQRAQGPRYKIMILGGYWEYHHNQICFLNYLESLQGSGFATYQVNFEDDVEKHHLLEYDLVIFTRCRSKNAVELSKFCRKQSIASIYMLDDNWFSIAKEYKEYERMFLPGREPFDNFIDILTNCTAAWVYNDLIEYEVLPYARYVEKFDIAVAPEVFQQVEERKRTDDLIYVGFAGSMRFTNNAFRALARYARRHTNIRLVILGSLNMEQEVLFKNLEVERIEFTSYALYARNITKLSPDLLIAPLEDNITMRSKCYNKYIESGIVGAACIYSKIPPYTDIIIDNFNGFYLEEDTEEGWYCKLEDILSDINNLRKVQKNARRDILENHTVKNLLFQFTNRLIKIIQREANINEESSVSIT